MRRLGILFISVLLLHMLGACEFETSSDGNLYGYWHLESIDTLNGGFCDTHNQLLFWAVQANILECSDRDYAHSPVVYKFEESDGKLILSHPVLNDREKGDPEVTELGRVQPFGIGSLEPVYDIEKLKTDRLVISDGQLRLSFRKL